MLDRNTNERRDADGHRVDGEDADLAATLLSLSWGHSYADQNPSLIALAYFSVRPLSGPATATKATALSATQRTAAV
jgi:hypothetical protein